MCYELYENKDFFHNRIATSLAYIVS